MYAVILASGSGTRQRPLRGTSDPQAFQRLEDGRTLLQHTVSRLAPLVEPNDVVVVTDRRHGQRVREQLPDVRIVTEPQNRGTAASLALGTVAVERPPDETMIVVCADHQIEREDSLREALSLTASQVVAGAAGIERPLITFGIRPTSADPQLTYLQPSFDDVLRAGDLRLYAVRTVEAKPDNGRTRQLYESGNSFWSSGIFVWQRGAISDAIERYTPLFTLLRPAHRSEIALTAAYDRLQPLSIDEAILVGAARDGSVLTAPLDVGWHELAEVSQTA
ncbi:MAG TPA: sugar phosphate nucleotidyltransferase [Candidatus Limnocylindria bacterium]|nr:sugar phosphate nucleotidyltransferase [Candidatus Limnocylindria bacterium]